MNNYSRKHTHGLGGVMNKVVTLEADALLFDLDGVLVDSTQAVERHWRAFAEWFDLDAEDLLTRTHGMPLDAIIRRELAGHPEEVIEAAVGKLEEIELADAKTETALPGAHDVLATLPKGRWAVVTSCWNELAKARAAAAGIELPEVLVTSDQLKAGKPAPDGYLEAARRLGVEPSDCIVFEDAPSGITAALAANTLPVAVRTTTHDAKLYAALGGKGHVVDDLRSVIVRSGIAQAEGNRIVVELRT